MLKGSSRPDGLDLMILLMLRNFLLSSGGGSFKLMKSLDFVTMWKILIDQDFGVHEE